MEILERWGMKVIEQHSIGLNIRKNYFQIKEQRNSSGFKTIFYEGGFI